MTTERDKQQRDKSADPDENARVILDRLSLATHHYVRDKTKALTKLKDTKEKRPSVKAFSSPQPLDGIEPEFAKKNDPWKDIYSERLHSSSDPGYRGVDPHAKDYARIIHSPAFRRLQGKSQLIPAGENEFFRTRLTHSLEVAEIASRIARWLDHCGYLGHHKINVDLVSCAALLHDIGHPPFGHSGEEALNERMVGLGGFEGNAQTFRIVTKLENRLGRIEPGQVKGAIGRAISYPRGLNLTVGTLAAVLKYPKLSRGPQKRDKIVKLHKGYYEEEEPVVKKLADKLNLKKITERTLECQIMDFADDIAYSAYDLEDTLESGIVSPLDLMTLDDETIEKVRARVEENAPSLKKVIEISSDAILKTLADVFSVLVEVGDKYDLAKHRRHRLAFVGRTYLESIEHAKNPLVRRQYLETLIERNIEGISIHPNFDFPALSRLVIDPQCLFRIECMKAFNFHKVITSRRLKMYHYRSREIIQYLFDIFVNDKAGHLLPDQLRREREQCKGNKKKIARIVCDHISSLTDQEAIRLHDQLRSSRNAPFTAYWR